MNLTINMGVINTRLFRALTAEDCDENGKYILSSHERAFHENSISRNINVLNEIYTHTMPSHKLETSRKERIIISFTDDIRVALMFMKKNKKVYKAIGYIDIEFPGNPMCVNESLKGQGIFSIIPTYRISDWVEMAIYNNTATVKNVASCRTTALVNTLIPSRWSAFSLAHTSREYAIICRKLTVNIMSEKEIEECKNQKTCYYNPNYQLSNSIWQRKRIINQLRAELKNLNITAKRQAYVANCLSCTLCLHNNPLVLRKRR